MDPRERVGSRGNSTLQHFNVIQKGSGTNGDFSPAGQAPPFARRSFVGEQRIIVAKRSAVSTGQLRRLPVLHIRPIDLVVFQEPSDLAVIETSS
jgi:hypothetical protein